MTFRPSVTQVARNPLDTFTRSFQNAQNLMLKAAAERRAQAEHEAMMTERATLAADRDLTRDLKMAELRAKPVPEGTTRDDVGLAQALQSSDESTSGFNIQRPGDQGTMVPREGGRGSGDIPTFDLQGFQPQMPDVPVEEVRMTPEDTPFFPGQRGDTDGGTEVYGSGGSRYAHNQVYQDTMDANRAEVQLARQAGGPAATAERAREEETRAADLAATRRAIEMGGWPNVTVDMIPWDQPGLTAEMVRNAMGIFPSARDASIQTGREDVARIPRAGSPGSTPPDYEDPDRVSQLHSSEMDDLYETGLAEWQSKWYDDRGRIRVPRDQMPTPDMDLEDRQAALTDIQGRLEQQARDERPDRETYGAEALRSMWVYPRYREGLRGIAPAFGVDPTTLSDSGQAGGGAGGASLPPGFSYGFDPQVWAEAVRSLAPDQREEMLATYGRSPEEIAAVIALLAGE